MALPTGFADAATKIETRFKTGWGSTTLVQGFDNWKGPEPNKATTKWARFAILHGNGVAASISGGDTKLHRHTGIITISIFTELGIGAYTARTLADTAAGLFRDITADEGITYRTPQPQEIGDDNHGWYQYNVLIPFQLDMAF